MARATLNPNRTYHCDHCNEVHYGSELSPVTSRRGFIFNERQITEMVCPVCFIKDQKVEETADGIRIFLGFGPLSFIVAIVLLSAMGIKGNMPLLFGLTGVVFFSTIGLLKYRHAAKEKAIYEQAYGTIEETAETPVTENSNADSIILWSILGFVGILIAFGTMVS